MRQATDRLVRARRLERRRGSGTFVTPPPPQVDLFTLAGTMASFQKGGIDVETELLQRPKRQRVEADRNGHPFAGREVYFMARLSRVADRPVLLEEIWLDPAWFPGLGRLGLAGRSLSQLVEAHYGLRAVAADQTFQVAALDPRRAGQLGPRG